MTGPQSGGGYYPQQGYPANLPDAESRRGSPVLAIIAAVVGLGLAGALTWQAVEILSAVGDRMSDYPAGWQVVVYWPFVTAGFALIGVVLVLTRRLAGAFVLLLSGVLAIAAQLTAPLIAEDLWVTMIGSADDIDFSASNTNQLYFNELFELDFDSSQATLRVVALALAVLLMIIAALPPSLNWLRRGRENGYSEQQAGW